jgi:hypothetical protein
LLSYLFSLVAKIHICLFGVYFALHFQHPGLLIAFKLDPPLCPVDLQTP